MAKIRYYIQRFKEVARATPERAHQETKNLVIDCSEIDMAPQDVDAPTFCELEAVEVPTVFELDGLVYVYDEDMNTQAQATQAQATQAQATQAPATQAPATQAPATQAQATQMYSETRIDYQPSPSQFPIHSAQASNYRSETEIDDHVYTSALKEMGDVESCLPRYTLVRMRLEPPRWGATVQYRDLQSYAEASSKKAAKHSASKSLWLQMGRGSIGNSYGYL